MEDQSFRAYKNIHGDTILSSEIPNLIINSYSSTKFGASRGSAVTEQPLFGLGNIIEVGKIVAWGGRLNEFPERLADRVVTVDECDLEAALHLHEIVYGNERVFCGLGRHITLDHESSTAEGGAFVGDLAEIIERHRLRRQPRLYTRV